MASPNLLLRWCVLEQHSSAEAEELIWLLPERSKEVLVLRNHRLYKLPEDTVTLPPATNNSPLELTHNQNYVKFTQKMRNISQCH